MDTLQISSNPDIDLAIAKFPTLTAMSRALDLSGYQVIQEWRRQGRIPAEHCAAVERLTGIQSEKLNPRVDWAWYRKSSALTGHEDVV